MGKKVKNQEIWKALRKSIRLCLKMLWRYDKKYLIINGLMISVQGLLPAALVIVMQQAINRIQSGGYAFEEILIYIGSYICLSIVNAIMIAEYSYYNSGCVLDFNQYINLKMLEQAAKLRLQDFEDSEIYNIINRAQSQNGSSILSYVTEILNVIRQSITIMSTGIVLIYFRWWIMAIILVIPIIRCIATIHIDKKWYEIRISRTKEERRNWYINYLMMLGKAFKEIKILGIGDYLIKKYRDISRRFIVQDRKMQKKIATITIIFDLLDWCITGGVFIYIFFQGFKAEILIGDITAYIECMNNIKNSAEGIFTEIGNITEQSLYIDLLFQYFEIPVSKESVGKEITSIRKIELQNVSFKYDGEKYVLKNINMIIEPGTPVALAGENGSGKTTLIKVILGLYDDYEGEIFINDINLKEIDISSYQRRIGCVFQDYIKYEASVRENISYGNLRQMHDDDVIGEKIQTVKLAERVREMGGIDSVIGNWFGNQEISIGEWQRIAIARALIREADMYIFDEPDASLDIRRQKELISVYRNVMKTKIGIYVSHRVNYINLVAEKIYVLKEGEITEEGTHKALLNIKGEYFRLFSECNYFGEI